MISLGAGAPSAAYFPFKEIDVKVSNGLGSSAEMETPDSIIHMAKYDFEAGTNDYGKSVNLRI
jgi:hypothetical protein